MAQNQEKSSEKQAETTKKRSAKTIWLNILHILLIVLPVVACGAAIYLHITYPNEKLEELWFYMTHSATDSGMSTFVKGALIAGPICLVVIAGLILLQYDLFHKRRTITRVSKKTGKETEIQVYPIRHRWLFSGVIGLVLIGIAFGQIGVYEYIGAQYNNSSFIADHYANPRDTALITAPEKKRNLLVIELESMETTMFTKEQGGVWDHEVIPELYQLLFDEDAAFFASDNGTRGTQDGYGTTWTTASLIANTSGIPFKVPIGMNNSYHVEKFLQGAYSLGDVLKANGYRNVLLSGCVTSFGGVQEYFTYHGNYEIIDPATPEWTQASGGRSGMIVPSSQENEWGFSDEATFKMAQKFLSTEGDSEEPWHLFISTIDTHFEGYTYRADSEHGYTGSETRYSRQLENVYATTSRVVGEFVEWLKEQSFYENTTVVIIGDHVNMLSSFCSEDDMAGRGRYNLFLNSVVTTTNNKDRSFTSFDFYPSMLAAAGFTIQGDRLALGTNLFSSGLTLVEEYGLDEVNSELAHKSSFYIDYIIGREDYEDLESIAKEDGN